MKRLLLIASVAIMAAGCQKTTIDNVVNNSIDFGTEVGKQTRAIVQANSTTYLTDQPFGVYSYGYKVDNSGNRVANSLSSPMINVEVTYQNPDWKSNPSHGAYYWPNDPSTRLDFYAYSPYIKSSSQGAITPSQASVSHRVMLVSNLNHSEATRLTFEDYTHSNMYVDFMEAAPIYGATYTNQGGGQTSADKVPLSFSHKMTQVVFRVTTSYAYPGVEFTINKITLKGIRNKADYANGDWTESGSADYIVFPADKDNGATLKNPASDNDATVEGSVVLKNANANANPLASMTTVGVTMIPQTMEATTQAFEIQYTVKGTGVATEDVTKLVYFKPTANDASVDWTNNMLITYNVKIGLNEITFNPSVTAWDADFDNDGQVEDDYVDVPIVPTTPSDSE